MVEIVFALKLQVFCVLFNVSKFGFDNIDLEKQFGINTILNKLISYLIVFN